MNPEQLLEQLRQSELFSSDFPRRRRYTHAEWAVLPQDARRAAQEPASLAIQRVSNWRALQSLVRALGDAKHEPAIPVLAELWADCPLVPVRTAAWHALRAIESPAARAALESLIEDSDHLSVSLAVRAVFDADAIAAFERFAAYFEPERLQRPGGAVIQKPSSRSSAPVRSAEGRTAPRSRGGRNHGPQDGSSEMFVGWISAYACVATRRSARPRAKP